MLRLIFVWFLVAAVPLQGYAAATMTVCEASQNEQRAAADGDSHAIGGEHMHMSNDADPASDAVAFDRHHHRDGHDAKTAAKCGVCAACCTSIAATHELRPFSAGLGTEDFALPPRAIVAAFLTSGLERPPRFSFA